ncbi:MAG: AtpZ/AtpI family protein [Acidobacteriaceae bacterium]
MPTPEKPQNDRKTALRELVQVETMMQIALVLPLSCIIGWAVGDFLDHKLHQSWIGILGLALGIAAGLIQVIRMASHANRMDEKNDR